MIIFKLRPHHLLCNLCFQGEGYNEEFVQNFQKIHDAIENIKIIEGCDDICAKCPDNIDGTCEREQKVAAIDKAYLNLLQLETGQTITSQELLDKIKQQLTMNDFHKICKDCSWYDCNLCAPIIDKIVTL